MAEIQTPTSKRDAVQARLRKKYADKDFADDEAFYSQINDDYDDYDNRIKQYEDEQKTFSDMFTSDPRSAQFLTEWRSGKNPGVALVEMYGEDFLEDMKDPEKREEYAAASKAYAERVAKEKDFDEQYEKNIVETRNVIEQMKQEDGLTDDQIDEAAAFLIGIMKDGILGKFTAESFRMALNAINHDADVETASEEGEVRGRNTKIDEKLRKGRRGDGTASLDGKNGGGGTPRQAPELGALGAFDSSSIWERGGEKRKKYQ